jgi:hypothetical protein
MMASFSVITSRLFHKKKQVEKTPPIILPFIPVLNMLISKVKELGIVQSAV